MFYLIQTYGGATLHAFVSRSARDAKIAQLRDRFPRTPYTKRNLA